MAARNRRNVVHQLAGAVRAYSTQAAQTSKSDALALDESFRYLREALTPFLGRRDAHKVAVELRRAAEACMASSAQSMAAYWSFMAQFQPNAFGLAQGARQGQLPGRSDFFRN